MHKNLPVYALFCLLLIFGLGACNSGKESTNNTTDDSLKVIDSLKKLAKADSAKVDTTTPEFKASAIVMYSAYTQHIPHFEQAEDFTPSDKLKQEVTKRTKTCKDVSKQVWKQNKEGFKKCDCGGIENYVIFSPTNEWAYTRHLATDKKLADFQPIMDKEGLKFEKEGENRIFKVIIARGSWYEIVNTKNDAKWWFDKNLKFIKFLD
ncbi:hypothetical protein [uncultured Microscilla sp.]|uniref:hypothetical protein n=1 Tax=uncultured Microscilla sp. TaxID=432653 RepID=UPI0026163F47|nr:hypothetical protein [uncultured Microscilla sp.]